MAENSVKNTATETLKSDPSKKTLFQYLTDCTLQGRRVVSRSDDVWDRLRYTQKTAPQEEDDGRPSRGRQRFNTEPDTQVTQTPSSMSSGSSRRREPPLQLPRAREDDVEAPCLLMTPGPTSRVFPRWTVPQVAMTSKKAVRLKNAGKTVELRREGRSGETS